MLYCKKCHQSNFIKAEIARGPQHYKCKAYLYHFTPGDRRGKSPQKEKAVLVLLVNF